MSAVSDLLAQSRELHRTSKQHVSGRVVRRPADQEGFRRAHALRCEAHALDPGHSDPEWAKESVPLGKGRVLHDELMAFYKDRGFDELIRPPSAPQDDGGVPAGKARGRGLARGTGRRKRPTGHRRRNQGA